MFVLFSPWILQLILVVAIVCLFRRKWKQAALLVALAFVVNWCFRLIPLSVLNNRKAESIRVMIFNIDGSRQDSLSIKSIAQVILHENADFVFVGEDFQNIVRELQNELTDVYPYTTNKFRGSAHYLYSKTPIGTYERLGTDMTSYLFHYTISCGSDSLHFYGCHLASNNYTEQNDYVHPDSLTESNEVIQYLKDISNASGRRSKEVDVLLDAVKYNHGNAIILGDFNDISGSVPLNKIERAGFTDAWWKGGNGYGTTIHHPLPYRIDHIFYNEGLKLKSIRKVDSHGLSDHDALVAEFWVE